MREVTGAAVAVPGRVDVAERDDGGAEALAAAEGGLRREQLGAQRVRRRSGGSAARRAAISASRGSASSRRSGSPSTRPRLMASSVARSSCTSSPRPAFDVIMPRTCADRPDGPSSAQERIDQLVGEPLGVLAELARGRASGARARWRLPTNPAPRAPPGRPHSAGGPGPTPGRGRPSPAPRAPTVPRDRGPRAPGSRPSVRRFRGVRRESS